MFLLILFFENRGEGLAGEVYKLLLCFAFENHILLGLSSLCAMESFWHAWGVEMLCQIQQMTFHYLPNIVNTLFKNNKNIAKPTDGRRRVNPSHLCPKSIQAKCAEVIPEDQLQPSWSGRWTVNHLQSVNFLASFKWRVSDCPLVCEQKTISKTAAFDLFHFLPVR